jgi:hypothetical protein
MKAKIKPGSKISQDFGIFTFPNTRTGMADVDTVFDIVESGNYFPEAIADGYGRAGDWGCGPITVFSRDSLIEV